MKARPSAPASFLKTGGGRADGIFTCLDMTNLSGTFNPFVRIKPC